MLTHHRLQQLLNGCLYAGSAFMLAEFVYHLSGVRMQGIVNWPPAAVSFSYFFMSLWASASLLIAILLFYLARSTAVQKVLLTPLALFAILHSGLLWWWSQTPLPEIWPSPAMFVWNPYYAVQLKIEAVILLAFAGFVLWLQWGRKERP